MSGLWRFVCGVAAACLLSAAANAADVLVVSVKPYEKIVAKFMPTAKVVVMAKGDPHTYEPTPSQMRQISRAKAFFGVGIDYEGAWLPRFKELNPTLAAFDVSSSVKKFEDDPHIWLDPVLLSHSAENIAKNLASLYPEKTQEFQKVLAELKREFAALDARVAEILKGSKGKAFVVFHPSLSYFAARYGLEQIGVEEEGKEIKPSDIALIEQSAKSKGVKIVISEPGHSPRVLKNIARNIGAKIHPLDQLSGEIEKQIENLAKIIAAN